MNRTAKSLVLLVFTICLLIMFPVSQAGFLSRIQTLSIHASSPSNSPSSDRNLGNVAVDITGSITGKVTDTITGDPVSSIYVYAYWFNYGSWNYVGGAWPKTDGTYEITGLSNGRYRVQFWDPNFVYKSVMYEDILVAAGATTSGVDVSLSVIAHITGVVTDESTGVPIQGVNVYAYHEFKDEWKLTSGSLTQADGSYDLSVFNGNFKLEFSDSRRSYVTEYYKDAPDLDSGTEVAVIGGSITSGIDAQLAEGGHIKGTVTDELTSNPLFGIVVIAYGYNGVAWEINSQTNTDYNGEYDLMVLISGNYRLLFGKSWDPVYVAEYYNNAPDVESSSDVAVTVGGTTSGIDVQLMQGGHITGIVTDGLTGNLLQDVQVSVFHNNGSGWEYLRYDNTDASGAYDFRGLPTGNYRVRFQGGSGSGYALEYFDNAYELDLGTDVYVVAGSYTSGIDAQLMQGGHITGIVIDEETGATIEHPLVQAYRFQESSGSWELTGNSGFTIMDGGYDIKSLPPGTYQVIFSAWSGNYAPEVYDNLNKNIGAGADVIVTAGITTSGIDAALAKAGLITGVVTDEDTGAPIQEIAVYAYRFWSESNSWQRIDHYPTTWTDGVYTLGGLAAGVYHLVFSDWIGGVYSDELYDGLFGDVVDGHATDVIVTAGMTTSGIDASLRQNGHIIGTTLDNDTGTPIGGIDVKTYRYDMNVNAWREMGSASTGTDGTYDIGLLPSGQYQVEFSDGNNVYQGQLYSNISGSIDNGDGVLVNVNPGVTVSGIDASLTEFGSISLAGDCNGDVKVDAGDISALVLEIFDGDGNTPANAPGGSFPGDPVGCDANADNQIDAGDISCTVLTIFNGPGACAAIAAAQLAPAMTQPATGPVLSLPQLKSPPQSLVSVPLHFNSEGHHISTLVFSLDIDAEWLYFDAADHDQDGLPDAVHPSLPPGFIASVTFDAGDSDGELDFILADLFPPLQSLPDGVLAQIDLHTNTPPGPTHAAIRFSQQPSPSFGAADGSSIPGTAIDGAIVIQASPATLTPTPTSAPVRKSWLWLPLLQRDD